MKVDCAFCTNVANKGRILFQTEVAWAFLTNQPIFDGHTLIAPQRCVQYFSETTMLERVQMMGLMDKVQELLKRKLGAQGFNVAWNDGPVAGQTVPHLHMHCVPRVPGDLAKGGHDPRLSTYRVIPERPIQSEDKLQEFAGFLRAK
jgi:diadenosine tetraphosphate (Ap4A) HIT family hydrolase